MVNNFIDLLTMAYTNAKLFINTRKGRTTLIGRFFYNLAMKYRQFMIGRYGSDEYNLFLVITALVFTFLSRFRHLWFMYFLGLFLLVFSIFRMYSKNINKRYKERMRFLKIKNKITSWFKVKRESFKNRKTHKYFRCKKCKASIRVPKGIGKIEVTCPKCKNKFLKKV